MSFEELVVKIVGNLFTVVFVVRAFGAYAKKEYGDLIGLIAISVILVGFIYFTDQTIGIFKWLWNATVGTWTNTVAP